jgi:hypothetical protein
VRLLRDGFVDMMIRTGGMGSWVKERDRWFQKMRRLEKRVSHCGDVKALVQVEDWRSPATR